MPWLSGDWLRCAGGTPCLQGRDHKASTAAKLYRQFRRITPSNATSPAPALQLLTYSLANFEQLDGVPMSRMLAYSASFLGDRSPAYPSPAGLLVSNAEATMVAAIRGPPEEIRHLSGPHSAPAVRRARGQQHRCLDARA